MLPESLQAKAINWVQSHLEFYGSQWIETGIQVILAYYL